MIENLAKNIVLSYGERAATVNSIVNHTELIHGAKTKTSKEMQDILDNKALDTWVNDK